MEIVAIVGRPNVGKSSLFNRILGLNKSIVNERAGVTRDRIYGEASFEDKKFTIIDTGGFEAKRDAKIKNLILKQTEAAISEADKIIVLFDSKEGIMPDDYDLVRLLRKTSKEIFFAANKIDSQKSAGNLDDFYSLGIEKIYPISAIHGNGVTELLVDLVKQIPLTDKSVKKEEEFGIAIIGRPNVGKSSIINKILNYERVMVDDIPGTTRDAVDTPFLYKEKRYLLIDTAGIRRRAKIDDTLEAISVMSALRAVDRGKFVVLVIDSTKEFATQDMRIANYATTKGKGLLIVVNKMDLIEEYETIEYNEFREKLNKLYPGFSFAPYVFTSATLNFNIDKIMKEIERIRTSFYRKVETRDLNKLLTEIKSNFKFHYIKGKRGVKAKIKYITQSGFAPPRFLIFCNDPVYIKDKYHKFIENQLRKEYKFMGVPIELNYKKG